MSADRVKAGGPRAGAVRADGAGVNGARAGAGMTRGPGRAIVGASAAVALGVLLLRATAFPLRGADPSALVRLSWSARPERVERCRRLSDEELARRPAHMRLRWECEGAFSRYLLTMSVDGLVLLQDTVRGGGLRHDRPMHVLQERSLPAGAHRIRVELARLDSATAPDTASGAAQPPGSALLGAREAREAEERVRRAREAIAPRLLLDTTLTLAPRRVMLVTYDQPARRLAARMAP